MQQDWKSSFEREMSKLSLLYKLETGLKSRSSPGTETGVTHAYREDHTDDWLDDESYAKLQHQLNRMKKTLSVTRKRHLKSG